MPSLLFSSRKARREAKRREDDATTTTTTTTGKAETTRSMEDEGENDRDGLVSDFVDALRRDGTLEKLETAARRLAAETRRDVEKCRESSESTLRRRWTDAHPYRAASSSSSERRTRTRMTRMTTTTAKLLTIWTRRRIGQTRMDGWIERRRRAGEYGEHDGATGRGVVDVVVIGGAVGVIEWIARRARGGDVGVGGRRRRADFGSRRDDDRGGARTIERASRRHHAER